MRHSISNPTTGETVTKDNDGQTAARVPFSQPIKRRITVSIDADVIEWFKRQGPGYQARINQVLRTYMQAHEVKR